jgi:hypothetical protein
MSGTISGLKLSPVTLTAPAYVSPVTVTGTIDVHVAGAALYAASNWSVVNSGTIVSSGGAQTQGVELLGGGSLVNGVAGAFIYGQGAGVSIGGGAGTVANAGTINGSTFAVQLAGGYANRVIVDPGAIFGGLVNGGNTYGGAVISTVELATGAAAGVFASGFENFSAITVDSEANWTLRNGVGTGRTLFNEGTVSPVVIDSGAVVSNQSGGTIGGSYAFSGVVNNISGGASLDNAGVIGNAAGYGKGVYFYGGTIVNEAHGTISGIYAGVVMTVDPGKITNAGTIVASPTAFGYAVELFSGGFVTNSAGATISGPNGVQIDSGTLVNAGTISASTSAGKFAVIFGGNNGTDNRLIDEPGAAFTGAVQGYGTAAALELAAGTIAGTLDGLGHQFQKFPVITIDPGAQWSLTGASGLYGVSSTLTDSGTLTLATSLGGTAGVIALTGNGELDFSAAYAPIGATVTGLSHLDRIDVLGAHETVAGYAGGLLTLGGDAVLQLHVTGGFTEGQFQAGTDTAGTGTDITIACFAEGTRLLGERGEVAVEKLRVGDRLATAGGRLAPVRWLGHRRLDTRRHGKPEDVWPVRVAAGAFSPCVPLRDLVLSPDHAVLVEGVLIPIRYLVNGATVTQEPADVITYWHVELAGHDAVLAEGLPAESYLDTGNRSGFANGGTVAAAHPDFSRRVWHAGGCAELVVSGAKVTAAREALLRRAAAAGFGFTGEPAVELVAACGVIALHEAGVAVARGTAGGNRTGHAAFPRGGAGAWRPHEHGLAAPRHRRRVADAGRARAGGGFLPRGLAQGRGGMAVDGWQRGSLDRGRTADRVPHRLDGALQGGDSARRDARRRLGRHTGFVVPEPGVAGDRAGDARGGTGCYAAREAR